MIGRWLVVQATSMAQAGHYFLPGSRWERLAVCLRDFKDIETARPWVSTDAGVVPLCEGCKGWIREEIDGSGDGAGGPAKEK